MKTISSITELRQHLATVRDQKKTIGFVPTMGFLHEGHLSLVHAARQVSDVVVVSIFVNPLQFGPQEDFEIYPRDAKGDSQKLMNAGVDVLFVPEGKDLYPEGFQTFVEVVNVSKGLCGSSRPDHFRGVATVVAKLLMIVGADHAFFGEKDFQQLQVVRRLVRDLHIPVEIHAGEIVRDHDGLALSSRNVRLSEKERALALALPRSLLRAQEHCRLHRCSVQEIVNQIHAALSEHPNMAVDYVEIVHPETLGPVDEVGPGKPARLLAAVRLGSVRLIDNIELGEKS